MAAAPPTLLDWFTAIGALSGYVALAWTVFQERARHKVAERDRLVVSTHRETSSILRLWLQFNMASSHTSYVANIRVSAPDDAAVYTHIQATKDDGIQSGIFAPEQCIGGEKAVSTSLWLGHRQTAPTAEVYVARAGPLREASIKVTISDQATGQKLVCRKFDVSA